MRAALAAGMPHDMIDDDFRTPLLRAAREGHAAVVDLIAGLHPSAISAVDDDGWGAVELATYGGHADLMLRLLSMRGDRFRTDPRIGSPLHAAARGGGDRCLAVAGILLASGADPSAVDADGRTALHEAAASGSAAMVERLTAAGSATDAADRDGVMPVHVAARMRRLDIIARLLVVPGAHPLPPAPDAWLPRAPMDPAADPAGGIGHLAMLLWLDDAGVDPGPLPPPADAATAAWAMAACAARPESPWTMRLLAACGAGS